MRQMYAAAQEFQVLCIVNAVHLDAEALNDIKYHGVVVVSYSRMVVLLEMQERTETEFLGRCNRHAAQRIHNLLRDTYIYCRADVGFALDRHEAAKKRDES